MDRCMIWRTRCGCSPSAIGKDAIPKTTIRPLWGNRHLDVIFLSQNRANISTRGRPRRLNEVQRWGQVPRVSHRKGFQDRKGEVHDDPSRRRPVPRLSARASLH
jgi:hypothetical protein